MRIIYRSITDQGSWIARRTLLGSKIIQKSARKADGNDRGVSPVAAPGHVSTVMNGRSTQKPVELIPGNWVARRADGTAVACCPRIRQITERLHKLGIDRQQVTFQKLPEADDLLSLGGIEAEIK
jgi:hypothetical protein